MRLPSDNNPRPAGKVFLALTAGAVALLLVTAWTHESTQRQSTSGRRERLAELVAARQRRIDGLERELRDTRRRLQSAARTSRQGRLAALESELVRLAGPAGTRALEGSGIIVRLNDSPLGRRGDPESADFQIQDVDLQLIVNALWSAGAEAVAINGQRLVGTTAIRSAGGAILVNYRVLTSPYRIIAIGRPDSLERRFSASAIARRFRSWVDVYHLGFVVTKQRRVSVPAYAGAVGFRYAEPVPGK